MKCLRRGYAAAVAASRVTEELLARKRKRVAVELTTIAAFRGFWAMFLKAAGPNF